MKQRKKAKTIFDHTKPLNITTDFRCAKCIYLDLNNYRISENGYINYGCIWNGRTFGWVRKKNELNNMGCSNAICVRNRPKL